MLTASQYAAAAANAASIFPVGAPAGKRLRIHSVTISASVAGRYQLIDNSPSGNVMMYDGKLAASTPLTLTYSNGSLNDGYVVNDVAAGLTFTNQSGGVADIAATANYDLLSNNTA